MTFPAGRSLLIALLLPLAACARQPEPKPVAHTQTNEQGCTRQRSVGPQDAFADPAPLKQACVGPHLLEIPQNYFDNQTGTEHDGSFALALEYPSLEPFKPGERMGLTADIATRTVRIDYHYIDRIDVHQALRNAYTARDSERDDPSASLEGRNTDTPVFGLSPYRADVGRIRAYNKAKGMPDDSLYNATRWMTDWFVTRDHEGVVERIIKCTSQEVNDPGVEYRDGKLVKSKTLGVAECDHYFIVPDRSTAVRITYVREGLEHWKAIENRARALLLGQLKYSE